MYANLSKIFVLSHLNIPSAKHTWTQSLFGGGFGAASCAGLCFLTGFGFSHSLFICSLSFVAVGLGIHLGHLAIAKSREMLGHRWLRSIQRISIVFGVMVVIMAILLPWIYSDSINKRHDWPAPIAFLKDIAILWGLACIFGMSWYASYIQKSTGKTRETVPLQIEWRWGLLAIGFFGLLLIPLEFVVFLENSRIPINFPGFLESLLIRDFFLACAVIELVVWYRLKTQETTLKREAATPSQVKSISGNIAAVKILKPRGQLITKLEPLECIPDLGELELEAQNLKVDFLYVALDPGPRMIYVPRGGKRISNSPDMFEPGVSKLLLYFCSHSDKDYSPEEVANAVNLGERTVPQRRSPINKIFRKANVSSKNPLSFSEKKGILRSQGFSKLSILIVVSPELASFITS